VPISSAIESKVEALSKHLMEVQWQFTLGLFQ
jgi:hypothetical protein